MKKMLDEMKAMLMTAAHEQMEHLECVNAKELGEVIDMIKDIEEAMYYCTVTEAMHSKYPKEEEHHEEGVSTHSGMSHMTRQSYMEAKHMHHGKAKLLQELEKYMKDLGTDLMEMMEEASVEERQYLSNRLSALATKIAKAEA